jgi:hypothetical protein
LGGQPVDIEVRRPDGTLVYHWRCSNQDAPWPWMVAVYGDGHALIAGYPLLPVLPPYAIIVKPIGTPPAHEPANAGKHDSTT